ncbi:VOC family protein [Thermomonospora umbrina]|uniref:Putative enzyme related to lactoylglutathione lyase n=1 Tax=Thermomonospora umbrina TaxID=111806 RepID=A0A3D9SNB9_9ACTN|nr:VOC family protein [Thermomonospora umbrina]REE97419.1 putative enzyme related to lactoylglutathione lyase [Thermomonospora umbrina]
MLRGLATVNYWVDDVEAAKRWYTELLGIEPYFERPIEGPTQYCEFRVGAQQDELGLIDSAWQPKGAAQIPGGAIIHWHVDDVKAAFERLLSMGAEEYEPITEREAGFADASVVDPWGNILGIQYNPHYLEMSGSA